VKPSVHSMPKGAFIRAMRQIFTKTGRIAPRPQDAPLSAKNGKLPRFWKLKGKTPMLTTVDKADLTKTRIYRADGLVDHFDDPQLAYRVWLAAPKGVRLAFRSANDARPVYPHDFVDRPA